MKSETAQKLKFGDRVFVKHSCARTEVNGTYTTVHKYKYQDHEPCYGESGHVNIKCSASSNGEFISVTYKDLKRVNVLPKDCKAGVKVRIKENALSSLRTERGKVVKIIELNNRELSVFYGWAKLEFSPRSGFGNGYQCVKLSDLELYYE